MESLIKDEFNEVDGMVNNPKRRFRFVAKRSEAAAMRRTNQEKLRVAVLVSKAASSFMQDKNIQQESDFKLGKHGSLEYLRLILQIFSNMENMEWFLLYTSIILEGTSAVFEQL